jgi:hypothetical protein
MAQCRPLLRSPNIGKHRGALSEVTDAALIDRALIDSA